jgi:hypothetical protein
MNKKKVFHFVFCEGKYDPILDEKGGFDWNNDPGPFICDMLALKQPILFVTDILHFEMFLRLFDKNQAISVWIHRQANNKKEGIFSSYKGEEFGEGLISFYPNLKFKYVTRASNPPKYSGGEHPKEIIEVRYIIREFTEPKNWNIISDIWNEKEIPEPKPQEKGLNINIIDSAGVSIQIGNDNKIDVKQLTENLTQQGIPPEKINELVEILKTDNHDKSTKTFGNKTINWMKSLGAIATGATGKLLADAIKMAPDFDTFQAVIF